MSADYELTINDYLSILRRRWVQIVAAFLAIFAVASVVAITLPPVYRSTGTILVESQQISDSLVTSTITTVADERIEVIRQRVMTRDNLLRIIEKYGLFRDGYKSLTVSEKIDLMRSQIGIELVSANVSANRRDQATIAFRLSFDDRYPQIAHQVANDLVTLFLDENVKARTERATETTEFLTQEADKLKVELAELEGQVANYKQQHGSALPEHLELRMNMLSRTESELKEIERDYKSAQEELRFLDLELSAAKAGVSPRTGTSYIQPIESGSKQELAKLKAEYAKLVAIYKEAHPDVRALKRKIAALESGGSEQAATPDNKPVNQEASLDVAKVEAKISAANARVASLAQQQKALRARMGQYEGQIVQTPQVERGLTTLMRDYENAKNKYDEIRAKQMNAQIAENLEQENKAERFSLLEPPLMPDRPIKPDRKKLVVMGFFLALAGSGGVVMALEGINQRVRGASAVTAIFHQRPLVSIPYIAIKEEQGRRRRWLKLAILGGAIMLAGILALLHFLYMPLDIILIKIMARFN